MAVREAMKSFMKYGKVARTKLKEEVIDLLHHPIKLFVTMTSFGVLSLSGSMDYILGNNESVKIQESKNTEGKSSTTSEFIKIPLSLWASKDDDEVIHKSLEIMQKLVEEDPDEKKGGLWNEFSKVIKLWMIKDYANKKGQYAKLWNEGGEVIKLAMIKSEPNRNQFAKLLRFESTKSKGSLISLDQYMSRMISGQENIYYISDNKERWKKFPFLEILKNKDYEVIVLKDQIDEYVIQHLEEYKGKKFHDVFEDEFELENSFDKLAQWWKNILVEDNVDVKINHVLDDTPCVLVTSTSSLTAYLERLLQSQAILDVGKRTYMLDKRVLKINPKHPIIKELRSRVAKDPKDDNAKEIARIMYGIALLENGLELNDLYSAASHPYNLVQRILKTCTTRIKEEVEAPKAEIEGGRVRDAFEKMFPRP